MKRKIIVLLLCVVTMVLGANAATITTQLEAPVPGPGAIAQLLTCAGDTENINGTGVTESGTNDASTYVANDRTTQGQTFTLTGGGVLNSIWVKHVSWETFLGNGTWANFADGAQITVRVSSVSGTALTVLSSEVATMSTGSGFSSNGDSGSGRWLHIVLDTPVTLGAGTYAFDLTSYGPWFEMDGLAAGPYTNGDAYTANPKEALTMSTVHTGQDRTFVLDLATDIGNDSPANGATNISILRTSPENDLVFTIFKSTIEKVDVLFGTENDPNLTLKPGYLFVTDMPVTEGQHTVNLESMVSDLDYLTTYYWKVIGYEPNALAPDGFDAISGPVSSFTTKPEDAVPVVDAGDSVITTLALTISPNVLALNGSVTDDGVSALTVGWEAYDVAFGGGLTSKVTFADQTNPSTTVTISESGTYILNLSATDATGTVSDQIEIVVYDSDCDAAKATGIRVANYYDRDDNCVVNLLDFADFALEWLDSTALTESYLHAATVTAGTDNALFAEYWTGVSGTDPNNLLEESRYPASPNGSYLVVGQFSGSMTGDNYGQRIRGYIVPQTSGTYTFYIASDDGSRLFLSADTTPVDTNPALGNQIAEVPGSGWTNPNEWNKFPEQASAPVTLTAGQYYYVEVLHKEGTGGDNVNVGWSTDGGTTIEVIPDAVLRYALP